MSLIPYSRQSLDLLDLEAVKSVLLSDWITQGPRVTEFEERFAYYCGAKYAVAVSSGTAALHLAALVCKLEKGDEVITSPITFLATANAIIYAGATPVFADIDEATVNLNPQAVELKLSNKTSAIFTVHFAGLPAEMEKISHLARKRGIFVVED